MQLDPARQGGFSLEYSTLSIGVAMIEDEQECPFDYPGIRTAEYAGDEKFAAIYNIAPILPGHSLIIPRWHVARLGDLSEAESCRFFVFARRVTEFLLAHFQADGFDWSIQDGWTAGQTVGHVHLHVIPRWQGDLPAPGDWYDRLQMPVATAADGPVDSAVRPRLSDLDLDKIVGALSA